MKLLKRTGYLLMSVMILITGLISCQTANPTQGEVVKLNEQQVTSVVENMLSGYNDRDYAAFSHDLTTAMKLVIDKGAFTDFCAESATSLGKFQTITSVEQVESNSASTTWKISANFEQTSQQFTVTFDNGNGQVEGMDFGPQK